MVAIPLEQAIRELGRSAVAPLVAAAEQQRQEVARRFPREEWPTMAIERYAVGLSGHRDTFCRLLEFQTTDLGSIKGGSSRKLIIYKHKDKPGWYFDPSYPDVESAWRAVRAAFVEAFSLAEAQDWAGVDELVPLRSGAALRAKTVFSYAPAGLLPIYSREHIAHFRELLGDAASSVDAVQGNHALYELVHQRPEFVWLLLPAQGSPDMASAMSRSSPNARTCLPEEFGSRPGPRGRVAPGPDVVIEQCGRIATLPGPCCLPRAPTSFSRGAGLPPADPRNSDL